MGEAFLRYYGGEQFEVHSAGFELKGIHPHTTHVMDEVGIDIREQHSKATKDYMGRMHFNYLITVCAEAEKNCLQALWAQSGQKLHWPFDDPAAVEGTDAEKLAKFREVRDQPDRCESSTVDR
jgi:arsenate reductase